MIARFHLYILVEVLKLFSIALIAATSLIMVGGVAQQMIAEGLGPLAIIQLMPYFLPLALQFAVPATLLFAVCSVYGRMSADNEIVALKSVGLSPSRVMTPTLILAFLFSPLAVWTSDLAVSWGKPGINRVVMNSIEEIVYRVLRNHRSYSTSKGFSIHVQDVQDRWLIQPTINLHPENGQPMTISATKGQLKLDPQSEKLRIQLYDAQWDMGGKVMGSFPGVSQEEIPLNRATRKGVDQNTPSQFPLREIGNRVNLQLAALETHEDKLATMVGIHLMSGRFDQLDHPTSHHLLWQLGDGTHRLSKLRTEPWRRWAMGFSCFFFIWLGIPLAISMKSADYWTSFGACFLPILLLYYPIFAVGLDRAKNGIWPAYSVWLGNAILFVVGLWLMRKVYRH